MPRFSDEMVQTLCRDLGMKAKEGTRTSEWMKELEDNEPALSALYHDMQLMLLQLYGPVMLPVIMHTVCFTAYVTAKLYESQEEIEEMERQFS